jgi:hypothetical protein
MAGSSGPDIVNSGIIVYLDVANTFSYVSGSLNLLDLTNNKNNGVLTNGPTYGNENGGSFIFDGIDDYIDIAYSATFQTNNFTFCVWCNPSVNLDSIIASFETNIRGRAGWGLRLSNTGSTWGFAMSNAIRLNGGTVDLNYWQYVCGTYNGSNITLYKNGYQIGVTGSSTTMNSTSPIRVGRFAGSSVIPNFNGKISTFQFYNATLSAEDILKNYNSQKSRFGL